jgi:serine kinase of HPr protein (carbohydrate metabolism regulator)
MDMLLREIADQMQMKVLSGEENLQTNVTHAYISDILSDVMAKAKRESIWITNMTHMNVIAICFFKTLAAVILPDNLNLDEDVLAKAREKNIVVLSAPVSAFDVAGGLYSLGIRGE